MHRLIITTGFIVFSAWSQVSTAASTVAPPHPGRLLASNCFQCHGTDWRNGFGELAGKSSSSIYEEMKEMQAKVAGENIMNAHARGFSDNEIWLIADYFSKVAR